MSCSSFHMIVVCATILCLCYLPHVSFAGNNETDRIALVQIKARITHDPLGVTSSWNESFHFCIWYGITCDLQQNRVVKLDLRSTNLTSSLSPYLGNLTFLTSLILLNNSFFGSIPPEIGRLRRLQYLLLFQNNLSGVVPISIFNISSMEFLDLGSNQLHGSLPANTGITLPYLKVLFMGFNQFTGSIPSSLSNLSDLEQINLGYNNFHGQVPSLSKLRMIQYFMLSENSLGNGQTTDLDFVYSLANSTKIEQFHIVSNNFRGFFPDVICNFSMLIDLGISYNMISGQIPSCIGKLVHLQSIYTNNCQLSGIIPASIGELKNLSSLSLGNNQISGKLPISIGNLTQLSKLYLAGNKLEGQIPSSIGSCRNLQEVDMCYNSLSGSIPSEIFTLPSLSVKLSLSHNRLSGPLPVQVGGLKQLATLDLASNWFSGDIPSTLSACQSLVHLYLGSNFFRGSIPSSLSALEGLSDLDLSQNNLSGRIPEFLATFKLDTLDLSNNDLEGQVPEGGIFSIATNNFSVLGNSKLCGGIPELKLPQCDSKQNRMILIIVVLLSVFSGVILLVAIVLLYDFYRRKRSKKLTTLGSKGSQNSLPNLSYQSLLKSTNGFSSENLIGSGSFGVVYKGILDESSNTNVAIKKFNMEHKGAFKSFMAECEVLRNIRHRNLVKVITACSSIDYQGNDFKALVYEYMGNGSLDDWLHPQPSSSVEETKSLNLLQRLDVAVDVAFALEYLHDGCCDTLVVHCDLKPSNVLLDEEMVAHVGDFGLAKFLSTGSLISHSDQPSSFGVRGTVGYTPPEYGMGNEVSKYGDVYSFGILIMEMLTGKRPTDTMFKDSSSLRNYVKASVPEGVTEILDNALLLDIVGDNMKIKLDCVILVLEIALFCSNELPQQRLDMKDVVDNLSSIRNKLLVTSSHHNGELE